MKDNLNTPDSEIFYRRLTGPKEKISSLRGIFDICYATSLLIGSVVLFSNLHSLFLYPLACIVIGSLQFHMLNLAHAGLHWHLLPNKKWNDLITAWVLSYPIGTNLHYARHEHFQHHLHFNTEKDPVRVYYENTCFQNRTSLVLYFLKKLLIIDSVGRLISLLRIGHRTSKSETYNYSEFVKMISVQFIILFCFTWYDKASDYFFFWLLPAMTVANFLLAFRSYVEHAKSEPFENTSSTTGLYLIDAPYLEKIWLGSFGFDRHAMHHFYPTIPYYQMHKYEKETLKNPSMTCLYSSRKGYLSFFLKRVLFRRQETIHA